MICFLMLHFETVPFANLRFRAHRDEIREHCPSPKPAAWVSWVHQAFYGRNGDCQNGDLSRVSLQMTIPVTYGMNNRKNTHFASARDAKGAKKRRS